MMGLEDQDEYQEDMYYPSNQDLNQIASQEYHY